MKLALLAFLSIIGVSAFAPASAQAAPVIGEAAPDFTAMDTMGVKHSLSDFQDKIVVLEWSNHECPFVEKQYGSGNMQKLQKDATDKGVIWLTIVSSALGKQGNVSADEANKIMKDAGAHATARLLDTTSEVGKLYDAKTTPHMFVIDKEGVLVYEGAIDSDPSFNPKSIEGATNYVTAALNSLEAGTPIEITNTQPYGCGVKY